MGRQAGWSADAGSIPPVELQHMMSDPLAKFNLINDFETLNKFREIITESELGSRLHVVVDELTELHHGQCQAHWSCTSSKDGHTDVSGTPQGGAIYGQANVLNT